MLRIFGHFVPVPALALGFLEVTLLACAFFLVNAPGEALHLEIESVSAQISLAFAVFAVLTMVAVGLYQHDVFLDPRLMAIKAVAALALMTPLVIVAGAILSHAALDGARDGWTMWCLKASFVWMVSVTLTRSLFLHYANSDLFRRPVIVLGTGLRAERVAELMRRGENRSFFAKSYVHAGGDMPVVEGAGLDLDGNSDLHALARHAREIGADEIVVATDDRRGMPIHHLLNCKIAGVNVIDWLTFWERETRQVDLETLQPSWLVFSDGFRQGNVVDAMMRVFDVAVSVALLVLTLPVILAAAIAVRIEDGAPSLYRQERVGRGGKSFTLLKFRSMRVDAEAQGAQWAKTADARVTRVGNIIRKFRIDELPQLWNVLRGDMSFVGPRPERPIFVDDLAGQIPFYGERHSVKPGITGWAQVNYPYGASLEDARRKLAYDLYYVKNRTLFLDFLILIQTIRVILFHEGAR